MKILRFSLFAIMFSMLMSVSGSFALANGRCVAADHNDAYYVSVCSGKTETPCKWESNCRWTTAAAGSCSARDENNAYYASVCSGKNETLCNWEENCVWNY